MTSNKLEAAYDVLVRAQEQIVGEIAACGNNGGIGRAQNYAPVLVQVAQALAIVGVLRMNEPIRVEAEPEPTPAERMAALRALKAAKQTA
jgi:hypothetical protein